jgi:glycyl-tRNA synthetase beta chain
VIANCEERSRDMIRQLRERAKQCQAMLEVERGMHTLIDAEIENALLENALVQEVTALVERPNVMVCSFEKQFLDVPQECLILTMKANQKYFPLLDMAGKLTNQFLVVSNISPEDASAVIGGNERVVRPRLADAKFFFDQDRKKTLVSRVEGLGKVVYHNKLGTQGERTERVRAIAKGLAALLHHAGDKGFLQAVDTAAQLAKTDLLTDMVGEFPELQGIMGAYYARHDGLPEEVAQAIEDHYKPRFAGDELPRNIIGMVVALADKLETLVGMFGIGNLPTGDRDPFALRRHALGVVRMLGAGQLRLDLKQVIPLSVAVFGSRITDPSAALLEFIYDRLSGSLREQGFSAQEVEAVLALRPGQLGEVYPRLEAVRQFAALPESQALAAANKRIANILKKAPEVDAHVNQALLQEDAEKALYAAMQKIAPQALAQFEAGNYTASLQTLAALRAPVDAFFDDVMVNAEAMDLRLNRQGLLKSLHLAMNRVADLSCLAA